MTLKFNDMIQDSVIITLISKICSLYLVSKTSAAKSMSWLELKNLNRFDPHNLDVSTALVACIATLDNIDTFYLLN
jgi:hypothetical protein